ncbi:DUF397 domain-containing protein [Nocardiopsis sp. NPDC049922]|uniref:DUF397 domain-containing protein n=1 Tax=Nocardiopsis sp. NPDC049922 TaxID=3155157 RepID=UPI0033E8312D
MTQGMWRKSSYSIAESNCVETLLTAPGWHKSGYSAREQSCVEVNETPQAILVRDTQHRDLGHLAFPGTEWTSLVDTLKSHG